MINAFVNGGRFEIRGFCFFFIKEYNGYPGRNPKTGKKVQAAPKKYLFSNVVKNLKKEVITPVKLKMIKSHVTSFSSL